MGSEIAIINWACLIGAWISAVKLAAKAEGAKIISKYYDTLESLARARVELESMD